MFEKMIQVMVVAATMATAGSALAAPGKRPSMTPREVSGVVNINTASASQFEQLPGIGRHTAGLIVAYREKTPFKSTQDIVKVKGVGQGIYRKIGKHLTLNGPTTLSTASRAGAGAAVPAKADDTSAARPN